MYLYIGSETVVKTGEIVGVFDMDNTTISKHTRDYLAKAQRENRVINVTMELPKSFVVCSGKNGEETAYITQVAASTILKRLNA